MKTMNFLASVVFGGGIGVTLNATQLKKNRTVIQSQSAVPVHFSGL
jgi:hypothetical protein